MVKKKEDINIRSEEVVDIMSKVPHGFIRHGLFGMLILTVIGIGLLWFIHYPEIIIGNIKISTSEAPVKLIAQSNGVLTKLYVSEGSEVKEGTLMASIENPLSQKAASYLQKYIFNLEDALLHNENNLPLPDQHLVSLGDLQLIVNQLQEALNTFNISRTYQIEEVEIKSIIEKIINRRKLIVVNEKIVTIAEKDLKSAYQKYLSEEKLYNDGVIAKMEFIQLESSYRKKELDFEKLNESLLQQKDALNALELQLEQIKYNKYNKNNTTLESIQGHLKSIKSYVVGWQQKYNLLATKSGKVTFLKRIQAGDFINGGTELFVITPNNLSYIGIADVPAEGLGKIKKEQRANILLKNYPYYEYGSIEGKVKSISNFPQNNLYRVELVLTKGLKSNQKINLIYHPEMEGEVEIITSDKRLLERLFESLKRKLKRKQ